MGLTTLLPTGANGATNGIEVCYMGLGALLPTTYGVEFCYVRPAAVLQEYFRSCYIISGEVSDEIGFATYVLCFCYNSINFSTRSPARSPARSDLLH